MSSAEIAVVAVLIALALATSKIKAVGESSAWQVPSNVHYAMQAE